MWTLKYAICGEVLKLNKGFLSSDYAACCLVSMMMLCRNIKRTRLNREDCRDKFYIFNTYFYGKLEEALHPRVRSFVSCRHTSFTKWLAIMSLCKNGIIILFWVRGTWVPCNRSFCSSFFPRIGRRPSIVLLRRNETLVQKTAKKEKLNTQTHPNSNC